MTVDSVIDFFSDNMFWLLIGFIIIVMAIIGYFAEKKVFNAEKKPSGMKVTKEDNEPVVSEVEKKDVSKKEETSIDKKKEQKTKTNPKKTEEKVDLDKTEALDFEEIKEEKKKSEKNEDVWDI